MTMRSSSISRRNYEPTTTTVNDRDEASHARSNSDVRGNVKPHDGYAHAQEQNRITITSLHAILGRLCHPLICPRCPNLSLPDFSSASDTIMNEFNFAAASKSKNENDLSKVEAIAAKANIGALMNALITSGDREAHSIQHETGDSPKIAD